MRITRLLWLASALLSSQRSLAFLLPKQSASSSPSLTTALFSTPPPDRQRFVKKTKHITLGQLQDEMKRNPKQFQDNTVSRKGKKGSKKSTGRTRQRVEQPKQTYLYKAQRDRVRQQGGAEPDSDDDSSATATSTLSHAQQAVQLAAELGFKVAAQHCDAPLDAATVQPVILGRIRVADGETSGSYAYCIEKPAGWAILGGKESSSSTSVSVDKSTEEDDDSTVTSAKPLDRSKFKRQAKAKNEDGSLEVVEFNELDILALLTPEEREQYIEEHEELKELKKHPFLFSEAYSSSPTDEFETDDDNEILEQTAEVSVPSVSVEPLTPETELNLKRIAARAASNTGAAKFADAPRRPSVVSWLKDHKRQQDGSTIRGGNFWVALAGATEVDDSGVVLLCPRGVAEEKGLCAESIEYVAVVGNGAHLQSSGIGNQTFDGLQIDVLGKLRMGRMDDVVQAAQVNVPEVMTTCSQMVGICQKHFREGIRGDVGANPMERRAWRRLIHCSQMSLSSLDYDESLVVETANLPDDIAPVTNRRPNQKFFQGSWLGRSALRDSPHTNAYREINGAADGFPGWTVDRYGKWLFVQHDPELPKGPLPSIHDGNTAGVYYLEASQDRTAMGSNDVRPILLEGQSAPDVLPVLENGVKYFVSLDKDLSTGMFLDQRPSRAWLARNCCADTKVLNCFAHTGAFSVAAAIAGASTVSIDLSRKWLDRLPSQLEANGIPFDERHDCLYGDCFEWLAKLAKRGEKYDIVILDPPSTSVGGSKKKRWSVTNDMDALVALAARVVKPGGLLWTTTNSARMPASSFARRCKRGLDEAGCDAKLERIQNMPVDFPCIGPQPVKNLVWRIASTRTR